MSYQILTVEETAGGLALKRRDAGDLASQEGAVPVYRTQSGDPAAFADGSDGRAVKGFTAQIVATQAGSGDPSPTNIRKITGWTGADVRRTGVNLWGGDELLVDVKDAIPSATINAENRTVSFKATDTVSHVILGGSFGYGLRFKPDTRYTFILTIYKNTGTGTNIRIYYTDGTYKDSTVSAAATKETRVIVTDAGKTVAYVTKRNSSGTTRLYADECGLFEGVHTAADFVPYAGESAKIDWTDVGEVGGGSVDVTGGKLYRGAVIRTLTGNESWTLVGSGDSVYYRMQIDSSAGTYKESAGICSHLVRYAVTSSNTEPGFNFYYSGSSFRLTMRPGVSGTGTLDGFKAWLAAQYNAETPVQVLYYRVTPEAYDVEAKSFTTGGGENRAWADCGPVDITFAADTGAYIDGGLAADRAMIADAAPGFIAGRNFTAGEFLTVGDTLYRVTANIASGGDVVPGVNVTETTVGEEIAAVPAVDDTLTQSGDAADAKVTGDNLSEVKSAARAGGWLLPQPTTMQAWSWDSGTFSGTTGEDTSNSARLSTLDFVWPGKGLYGAAAAENYEFSVFAWSRADNSFVGRYTTDGEFSDSAGATDAWLAAFDFTPWPDYKFKIVLRHSDDPTASMALSLGSKCSFTAHKWMVNDRITRAAIAPTVYKSMGGYVTDRAYNAGDFMMTDDGKLLKATEFIGAEYFVGSSNSVETTVGEQLALLWAAINS